MTRATHGKVHGKTIELDEDLGVADGQEVEVHVRVIRRIARMPGEGFLRTEGALADGRPKASIQRHSQEAASARTKRRCPRRMLPKPGKSTR